MALYVHSFRPCLALIGLSLLVACAGSTVRNEGEAARNRANLIQLSVGQTKSQVAAIMGTPYKTEVYPRENGQIEFWLYLTLAGGCLFCSAADVGAIDSNFTPLAFENGVLQGWGRNYRNYYDTTMRVKKEVTIKQE